MRHALAKLFLLFACTGLAHAVMLPQSDPVDALHEEASSAEARGDLDTAITKYQQILKLNPRLGAGYNNLGALYFKQGRYKEAADTLEHGLKIDPSMSSASALLGLTLFQMGEYRRARPKLEAAVKAHPADNNAEMFLVNDLTKLGEFEAAAAHLQQLAKREPQNERVWYLLGRVYMQLSEQALGKINDINPNSVWSHEISAELMDSMKNYDGAVVEYKKALEIAPQQAGLHYKLGDVYWSLSQWDNARAEFLEEQKVDPRNCMVDYKLGDIFLQKGEGFDEALAHIDKSLAACPGLMEARADRGKALLKLHRESEALPELLAAEKANPTEASTHFLLAQAYRATGKAEEARAEMKTFGELEQKSRNAAAERAGEVIKNNQGAH
jgi:tetratricopeptide (TPR) repeat protein